jgi:hypothetical protein
VPKPYQPPPPSQSGDARTRKGTRILGYPWTSLATVLTLTSFGVFGVLRFTVYADFYHAFGVSPEQVGVTYADTWVQSMQLMLFGALYTAYYLGAAGLFTIAVALAVILFLMPLYILSSTTSRAIDNSTRLGCLATTVGYISLLTLLIFLTVLLEDVSGSGMLAYLAVWVPASLASCLYYFLNRPEAWDRFIQIFRHPPRDGFRAIVSVLIGLIFAVALPLTVFAISVASLSSPEVSDALRVRLFVSAAPGILYVGLCVFFVVRFIHSGHSVPRVFIPARSALLAYVLVALALFTLLALRIVPDAILEVKSGNPELYRGLVGQDVMCAEVAAAGNESFPTGTDLVQEYVLLGSHESRLYMWSPTTSTMSVPTGSVVLTYLPRCFFERNGGPQVVPFR